MSTPPQHQEFGAKVRELREQAGYSRQQLANATGWHVSKVAGIEGGKQLPAVPELVLWARLTRTPEPVSRKLREELTTLLAGSRPGDGPDQDELAALN